MILSPNKEFSIITLDPMVQFFPIFTFDLIITLFPIFVLVPILTLLSIKQFSPTNIFFLKNLFLFFKILMISSSYEVF